MLDLTGMSEFLLSEYDWAKHSPSRQQRYKHLMAILRDYQRVTSERDALRAQLAEALGAELRDDAGMPVSEGGE